MSKIVKTCEPLNFSYKVKGENGKTEKMYGSYPKVNVTFKNPLTREEFLAIGVDAESDDDDTRAIALKKVDNIVRHFNEKILQHDASTATRSLAGEVHRGEKKMSELLTFEYTHDYTAEKKEKMAPVERMNRDIGKLSAADKATLLEALKASMEEETSEEDNG